MCTAVTYCSKCGYFGRNLDFEHSFGEKIVIVSRNFPFVFRSRGEILSHYAIIGMGIVSNNFPLYFDGANEEGLCMAGLLFSGYAHFHEELQGYDNIASFELIPWVLSQCKSVSEAKELLRKTNVTNLDFSEEYPSTPLHWIVSDKHSSITVESCREGLFIYDNEVGVLANSPTFPMQMFVLNNYMSLSPNPPENHFSEKLKLIPYSRGMGSFGLPGDLSSTSRFVRGAFTKLNSASPDDEQCCVNQVFHILGSVYQTRGLNRTEEDFPEITYYSSCINIDEGIYYYTTYDNMSLNAVKLSEHDTSGERIYTFPLERKWQINFQR